MNTLLGIRPPSWAPDDGTISPVHGSPPTRAKFEKYNSHQNTLVMTTSLCSQISATEQAVGERLDPRLGLTQRGECLRLSYIAP